MEKNLMIQNLGEAEIQLKEIIDHLKNIADYDIVEFQIEIQHLMSHINIAYNIRTWSKEQLDKNYCNSFEQLRQIPKDKYLIE